MAGAAALVAAAGVLGAEVLLARRGPVLAAPDLALVDGRVGGGAGPALRVVWLGDSTAAGVGAGSAGASLPRLVAAGLGRPAVLTVLAVSGARVADVAARQAPRVAELGAPPDLVLVSVGANDATHVTRRDAFRARYEEALRALPTGATTRVVLLGVPDMGSPPRLAQPLRALVGWRGRALDAEVRAVAAAAGATYVDVEGETGPAFRRHPDRYFAADRYHPSAAGYALWADAVVAALGRPDRRPSPGVP